MRDGSCSNPGRPLHPPEGGHVKCLNAMEGKASDRVVPLHPPKGGHVICLIAKEWKASAEWHPLEEIKIYAVIIDDIQARSCARYSTIFVSNIPFVIKIVSTAVGLHLGSFTINLIEKVPETVLVAVSIWFTFITLRILSS